MDELRTRRVSETMREELSELIRFESADPRIHTVEVSEVVVSPDMRRADVLVMLPPKDEERTAALAGLEAARHYLRTQLMQRLHLYRMPELRFRAATDASAGVPLERLLRRVRRGRPRE
ncbi:MAG TPA: 30S ribosome-binding factor RbfA [Paludibaculum sp.]|jgi:ribosome-binding factor A